LKNKLFRSPIGTTLVLLMILVIVPFENLLTFAEGEPRDELKIERIEIIKNYSTKNTVDSYYLDMYGKNLNLLDVRIKKEDGKTVSVPLPNLKKGAGYVQFSLENVGSQLIINDEPVEIGETSMPQIDTIEPIRIISGENELTVTGKNLDKIEIENEDENGDGTGDDDNIDNTDSVRMYYGREGVPYTDEGIEYDNDENKNIVIKNISQNVLGRYNIKFEKGGKTSYGDNEVTLKSTHIYQNIFSLYGNLDISEEIEMIPNRGQINSSVYFRGEKIPNLKDLEVFFLKNTSDPFTKGNKAEKISYNEDKYVNGDKRLAELKVEVPDSLELGEEYFVILTNNVDENRNIEEQINKQKILDKKFIVIGAGNQPSISRIEDDSGSNMGGYTAIISGQYLGSFNTNTFDNQTNPKVELLDENGSIITDENNGRILRITYGGGNYNDILDKGIQATSVVKEITGIIGNPIFFNRDSVEKSYFSPSIDKIAIEIPEVGNEDIQGNDAKKEVILIIRTIIGYKDNNNEEQKIEFSQLIKNDDVKFTFIPSDVAPNIISVTPPSISVEKDDDNYVLKKDVRLVIEGSNFLIHEYEKSGKKEYRYPEVEIGDLKLNKNDNSDIFLEILNPSGVVQGIKNNDIGNKLIIEIPKDSKIPNNSINRDINLTVTNPLRNSEGMGHKDMYFGFRFAYTEISNQKPVIASIYPYSVTMDGGEFITIEGNGFQKDVELIIEGKKIDPRNFTRESENKITFVAPPSDREVETQVQVRNPSYGTMDVHPFIYKKSITDPYIEDFNPKERTDENYFIITGKDFKKPNPAAAESDIESLIGTRVMIGNIDVNDYHPNEASPKLQSYESPEDKKILQIESDGAFKGLKLADYYYSVLLSEGSNLYTLDINNKGQIELYDGDSENNNRYIITMDKNGEKIIATKQDVNKTEYEVTPTKRGLMLKIQDTEISLTMNTLYRTENDEIVGNRVKVLSENKICVEVPYGKLQISQDNKYSITIVNPDAKRHSKDGFIYITKPEGPPKIKSVAPLKGSHKGGYEVTINGEGFFTTSNLKPTVVINGELVNPDNVRVKSSNEIVFMMPPYTGDIDPVNGTTVLINVINPDKKGVDKLEGFTYVYVDRDPYIDKVRTTSGDNIGSTLGGNTVIIDGYNFKLKESDTGNLFKDDINDNGEIDDFTDCTVEELKEEYGEEGFKKYVEPILPKVYFGGTDNQAQIVGKMMEKSLEVVSPPGMAGIVDIYIINNDYGISNRKPFVYKGSDPTIREIDPGYGKFEGNVPVKIRGDQFYPSKIEIYKEESGEITLKNEEKMLVQFVDEDISTYKGSTLITTSGPAIVSLNDQLLMVRYDGNIKKLTVKLRQGTDEYSNIFEEFEGKRFIPLSLLKDRDNSYNGFEMIKVEITKDNELHVERGYSVRTEYTNTKFIKPYAPAYLYREPGVVSIIITNEDGASVKGKFEYIDFDTEPFITKVRKDESDEGREKNITLDGKEVDATVVEFDYRGGNPVEIEGVDFLDGAKVKLVPIDEGAGSIAIADVNYENIPRNISFKMPTLDKGVIGRYYAVQIVNMKNRSVSGVTSSDEIGELRDRPIVILFKDGGKLPIVNEVIPSYGPQTGGTRVTILGRNFKNDEGGKKLNVLIGKKGATYVEFVNSRELRGVTPSSDIGGEVEVIVINPDGATSTENGSFTYISVPKIISIVDPADKQEKALISTVSIRGGQEIKLKGTGFMKGTTVYFAPKITLVSESQGGTGRVIYIGGIPYILEEGTEGNNVEVTDSETITVKTPPLKAGSKGVIVVNPDDGASPVYENLSYGLPEVAAPSDVVAELVYDRFIRVYWGPVSGATQYEVFVVADDKTTEFIGSTKHTFFAYNDLQPRTSYKFVVKAVGDYGSSKASRESNTVKTGRKIDLPDDDGGLAEDTSMIKTGSVANVIIGTGDSKTTSIVVDLTGGALAGSTEVVVSIPASVIVKSGNRTVRVIGKDFLLDFKPSVFNSATIRGNRARTDAGVRFVIAPDKGNTQVVLGNQLSTVYNLDATIYVGKTNTSMDYLAGSINLVMDYDVQKANLRKLSNISFNYFNPAENAWEPVAFPTDTAANFVSGTVNRLGKYTVVGGRR